MYRFVIPSYYLNLSRLKSKSESISLLLIYPLYLFFFIFFLYNTSFYAQGSLFFILLVSWMLIYEIGYLENDALTIQKEATPNIRIIEADIQYIRKNFGAITGIRIGLLFLLMSFIYLLGLLSWQWIIFFIAYVAFVRGIFFLHNTIRSRYNIATYLVLCVAKYFILPIIFLQWTYAIEPYLIILISFPILRTLEHAIKPKYENYNLQRLVGSLDKFRVIYYSICLGLFLFLYFITDIYEALIWSLTYFFVFRLGIYLLIRLGIYSRKQAKLC